MEHSATYEELKFKWEMHYITESTMRGWVKIHQTKSNKGITAEEFTEITDIAY